MKTILTLASLAVLGFFHPDENKGDEARLKSTQIKFDQNVASAEQSNPLFRWPLPKMEGEVFLDMEFSLLNLENTNLPNEEELKIVQDYINSIFNPHGIFINYHITENILPTNENLLFDWKDKLSVKEGKFVLYVIGDIGDELSRSRFYASNEVASERAILPYHNLNEFKVFAAKNLAHMLGLFPTYFDNSFLNVISEDANNCGYAGDFVCDTPFDYIGVKNDVKQKNCKYNGELGNPDVTNLLSNSWSKCMNHITAGQANKIKYNLSEISFLSERVLPESTIKLQGK